MVGKRSLSGTDSQKAQKKKKQEEMMKKILLAVAVMMVVIAMAGSAFAFTLTPQVPVTGTVQDKCTTPTDGSITFNIDPSSAGPITATTTANGVTPTVKCTKNSPHVVSCAGTGTLKLGGLDPILYTITGCTTPLTGAGFGAIGAVGIPLGISINAADYQDALAGDHSDTITVTVTY